MLRCDVRYLISTLFMQVSLFYDIVSKIFIYWDYIGQSKYILCGFIQRCERVAVSVSTLPLCFLLSPCRLENTDTPLNVKLSNKSQITSKTPVSIYIIIHSMLCILHKFIILYI